MNDNNDYAIECTRCGAEISLSFSRCPNCGLNLYPEDNYDPDLIDGVNIGSWRLSITSILLGWGAVAIFIFVINFLFKNPIESSPSQRFIVFSIDIVGAFVGGLVSGYILLEKPAWHGIVIGLLSIGVGLFFEMFWQDFGSRRLIQMDSLFTWGLMILGAVLGTSLTYHFPLKPSGYDFPEDEYLLYQEMLSRVQNDHGIVDRLIAYERNFAPNSNREIWLKNALERWERDNRL